MLSQMTDLSRLKPPFTIREHGESFSVSDAAGVVVCYLYYDDTEVRQRIMNRLSRDEAKRIAEMIVASLS